MAYLRKYANEWKKINKAWQEKVFCTYFVQRDQVLCVHSHTQFFGCGISKFRESSI